MLLSHEYVLHVCPLGPCACATHTLRTVPLLSNCPAGMEGESRHLSSPLGRIMASIATSPPPIDTMLMLVSRRTPSDTIFP